MLRSFATFCIIILMSTPLFAQKTINSYKYIIVPKQYEFQKSEDQYQLNSLTKFLFEREELVVFFSDDSYPKDLAENACVALKAMVKNNSNLLTTKVTINLVDCYNAVIYSSPLGKSKFKDYKKAYQDAIRKAFVGVQAYVNDSTSTKVDAPLVVAAPINEQAATIDFKTDAETKIVEENITVNNSVGVVAVPVVVPQKNVVSEKETTVYALEGTYFIDMWGKCVITKKGATYKVIGGDEDFEFAEIYSTSKSTIFMVKKTGFKETQLLELDTNGNLKIDSKSGVKIYKRVD